MGQKMKIVTIQMIEEKTTTIKKWNWFKFKFEFVKLNHLALNQTHNHHIGLNNLYWNNDAIVEIATALSWVFKKPVNHKDAKGILKSLWYDAIYNSKYEFKMVYGDTTRTVVIDRHISFGVGGIL